MIDFDEGDNYYRGSKWRRDTIGGMEHTDPGDEIQLEKEVQQTALQLKKLDRLSPILPRLNEGDRALLKEMGIKW